MKARDNPFRTERILRVRYRLRGEAFDDLLDRLKQLGYRGSIVGPNGTGKTTLLEDLEPALAALGFEVKRLRLDDRQRSFPRGFLKRFFGEVTGREVILFDGAEQMNRFNWHTFKLRSKKAGGLVITSHRTGMLPTLRECTTTPELLAEIIIELLGTAPDATRDSTVVLHQKHNGNLRAALREMYDLYAEDGVREPGSVKETRAPLPGSDLIGRGNGATLRQVEGRLLRGTGHQENDYVGLPKDHLFG